ncbi:THAP domain-containing protein 11 [Channa argus]|uniref:THAP domain-containing protein 11 n=1 Tax=Channa argus TaxID=215402 RepID=A0A6G1Q7Z0_CHAAH|nr:THAP domain-containing protein 11 [Channa argus]KAK2899325.1 hypothetical protein Q8A73_012454 [Channa argus]
MVGQCCCVSGCHSRSHNRSREKLDNGLRFFAFPKWKKHEGKQAEEITKRRRMAWVAAVRRKDITFNHIPASMKVCSLHFHSGQPAYEMLDTHPDWVPSLLLGHNEVKVTNKERFARQSRRRLKAHQIVEQVVKEEEEEVEVARGESENRPQQEAENTTKQEVDTAQNPDHHCVEECALCKSKHDEIDYLLEENRRLSQDLDELKMTEQFLKEDDVKVKYYTGLPGHATFQVLLGHVKPFLPQLQELTPFQMILLTFMRLRLDLPLQHISHLFRVPLETAGAAFQDTVSVLYTRLSPLVQWPDRESLLVSMPQPFVDTFGNRVTAIVDCFEVFVRRPSDLDVTLQTFSNYKDSRTLKYLVGITPQGVSSFISKGWGGGPTDKRITEKSGFLDKLLPGDIVLADRGFDIKDSVGLMCAEVRMSAFTRGHHQLEAKDAEETRCMAHLRSHVQKVVGVVRNKYKILSSTLPVTMVVPCEGENVTPLDKVVAVCCALTNLCPSVVK